MTDSKEAPLSSVHGIWHQHGEDAPHNHADGDQRHKHGASEYNEPEEQ